MTMEEIAQLINKENQGSLTEQEARLLDEEVIKWKLKVQFKRVGVNLFQAYVKEDDQQVLIGVYDIETAVKVGKYSIEELQALPVEMPKMPLNLDGIHAKNLVVATLRGQVQAGGKIAEARRLLAETLLRSGFSEKDLTECMGGITSIVGGKGLLNRLAYYLDQLQTDYRQATAFVEKAYARGWLNDHSVFQWFEVVNGDDR